MDNSLATIRIDESRTIVRGAVPVLVCIHVERLIFVDASDVDLVYFRPVALVHAAEDVDFTVHAVDDGVDAPHGFCAGVPPVLFGTCACREVAGSVDVSYAGAEEVVFGCLGVRIHGTVVDGGVHDACVVAKVDDVADPNGEKLR